MNTVVLHIVCDQCGNVLVGTVKRSERYFEYEPKWVPDTSHTPRSAGHVNFSDRWPLTGPGPKYAITVDCRRCGDLLTFNADEATMAAQNAEPSEKPATIRAYQHSVG